MINGGSYLRKVDICYIYMGGPVYSLALTALVSLSFNFWLPGGPIAPFGKALADCGMRVALPPASFDLSAFAILVNGVNR